MGSAAGIVRDDSTGMPIHDIIQWALTSAKIPSQLEPTGFLRSDGKRPDGMNLVPRKCSKLLAWDATCPDSFAPSYRHLATSAAGKVAAAAEEMKAGKYAHLAKHIFSTQSPLRQRVQLGLALQPS